MTNVSGRITELRSSDSSSVTTRTRLRLRQESTPAAIFLYQRSAAIAANLVRHERSEIAPDRAHCCNPQEAKLALIHKISCERHDQFGRQRDARRLNRHEDHDPAISCGRNYRLNENENYSEDSFGHGGRERKGYNTGIQPLAISNWHLAITAFCRLEVSPFLGLKANC